MLTTRLALGLLAACAIVALVDCAAVWPQLGQNARSTSAVEINGPVSPNPEVLWSTLVGSPPVDPVSDNLPLFHPLTGATVANDEGTILYVSSPFTIYAVNASSGAQLWNYTPNTATPFWRCGRHRLHPGALPHPPRAAWRDGCAEVEGRVGPVVDRGRPGARMHTAPVHLRAIRLPPRARRGRHALRAGVLSKCG
jgi:hypothetical protein